MLTTCAMRCKFNLGAMQSIITLTRPTFFTAEFSIYGQTAEQEQRIKETGC